MNFLYFKISVTQFIIYNNIKDIILILMNNKNYILLKNIKPKN